ncbi:MAG: hypothetical protein HY787_03985 [Deltaproteobacteria bacterium]|nr:hypothetical protein [Deltaproteobacteria bacterium]
MKNLIESKIEDPLRLPGAGLLLKNAGNTLEVYKENFYSPQSREGLGLCALCVFAVRLLFNKAKLIQSKKEESKWKH